MGECEMETGKLRISAQRMSGEEDVLEVPEDATVQVLRDAIARSAIMDVGRSAYRLIHNGICLNDPAAKLQELEVKDLSTVIVMKERSRDYTSIQDAQVVKCKQYPNGLVFCHGKLLVAHYFLDLEIYDSDFSVARTMKLPSTGSPGQICMAGDRSLVVAHRNRGVAVLEMQEDESMAADSVPELPQLTFSLKSKIDCSPQGVAVSGDRVFVTTEDGHLSTYRLSDKELLDHRKGGSEWDLSRPQGLCVIEDKLLAIADRGADRVLLLDIESMKCVGQLPPLEVWSARPKHGKRNTASDPRMLLKSPNDVAVDAAGNLLVMDTMNERVAVFRQDGSFVASVMEGFFKAFGCTYSYLACNHETGVLAISNNDMHQIAIVTPS